MKKINELHQRKERPVRVLQFGEGNFLRAFVDFGIDVANENGSFDSNVVVVAPIPGKPRFFDEQDSFYTVCLRGQKEGKAYEENRVVSCVSKVIGCYEHYDEFMSLARLESLEFVVSNTTEAGIVYENSDRLEDSPPKTFPAKLTKFLYERYTFFKGAKDRGLIMLPVELIEKNGEVLKKCVLDYCRLWKLEEGFVSWLESACIFAATLVDRIVTGYPREEAAALCEKLGYEDNLLDTAEPFGLWVIGDARVEKRLPINSDKLNVEFTDQIEVFKERKVRILNGAHTSMVLGAYLAGKDFVRECMEDKAIRTQLEQSVFGEIVPTVHLPKEKSEAFAHSVFERFENPFVKHALLSISLNSVSKWRARVLPSFKDSIANTGKLPKWLSFSFAALASFYRSDVEGENCLIGKRGNDTYEIKDDKAVLDFFKSAAKKPNAEFADALMKRTDFWGEDLSLIAGFKERVISHIDSIDAVGMKSHIEALGKES